MYAFTLTHLLRELKLANINGGPLGYVQHQCRSSASVGTIWH